MLSMLRAPESTSVQRAATASTSASSYSKLALVVGLDPLADLVELQAHDLAQVLVAQIG
jgi:hypothetical protein